MSPKQIRVILGKDWILNINFSFMVLFQPLPYIKLPGWKIFIEDSVIVQCPVSYFSGKRP